MIKLLIGDEFFTILLVDNLINTRNEIVQVNINNIIIIEDMVEKSSIRTAALPKAVVERYILQASIFKNLINFMKEAWR